MTTHDQEPEASRPVTRRRTGTPRRLLVRRVVAFLVALGVTLALAFEGGGYDNVIRDQIGIAIWTAIAVGLLFGFLPRARLTPAAWTALGGFAALVALTTLSFAWTTSDEATSNELARTLQYAGVVVLAFLSLNRYTWRGAATGFVAAALIVPFFAVTARLFPDLISDPVVELGTDRLSYPFGYWNAVSCWAAMAIAVGLTVGSNSSRLDIRAASLACVPVAALCVYLSYSRFGVAAVAVAVIAAVAFSRHRWTAGANALIAGAASAIPIFAVRGQEEIARGVGDQGGGTVVLALLGAAAVCAAVAAITMRAGLDRTRMDVRAARLAVAGGAVFLLVAAAALNGPIGEAWDKFKDDAPPPATGGTERFTSLGSSRYDVWSAGVEAFKDDPVRGRGPGTFEYFWSQEGEGAEFARDAHSLYIEQALELGLPGLLALLVGFGGLLWAAIQARGQWRRRREVAAGSAVMASFVVFLVYAGIDWMWEMGAIGVLALGGLAAAGAGGLDRAGEGTRVWVRTAGVALAVLAIWAQVPSLVSTERIRASDAELAAGDPDRALELADEAIDAQPWGGSPYAARAIALKEQGNLDSARTAAEDAVERDEENWRHFLLLAQIDAALGDEQAVERDLREVRRLAPRSAYLVPSSPFRLELENQLRQGEGSP